MVTNSRTCGNADPTLFIEQSKSIKVVRSDDMTFWRALALCVHAVGKRSGHSFRLVSNAELQKQAALKLKSLYGASIEDLAGGIVFNSYINDVAERMDCNIHIFHIRTDRRGEAQRNMLFDSLARHGKPHYYLLYMFGRFHCISNMTGLWRTLTRNYNNKFCETCYKFARETKIFSHSCKLITPYEQEEYHGYRNSGCFSRVRQQYSPGFGVNIQEADTYPESAKYVNNDRIWPLYYTKPKPKMSISGEVGPANTAGFTINGKRVAVSDSARPLAKKLKRDAEQNKDNVVVDKNGYKGSYVAGFEPPKQQTAPFHFK